MELPVPNQLPPTWQRHHQRCGHNARRARTTIGRRTPIGRFEYELSAILPADSDRPRAGNGRQCAGGTSSPEADDYGASAVKQDSPRVTVQRAQRSGL